MKFKYLAKSKIAKLPKTPGVYTFKKGRKFLYIGKAANLRNRVQQHFKQPRRLFSLAKQLGYIKTDSEIEALILEAKLIKKHQPKYNVVWRDDKNYFYICITPSTKLRASKEDFPRVFITHQLQKIRNSKHEARNKFQILNSKFRKGFSDFGFRASDFIFVGPFVEGRALRETLKTLRRVFPYYTQKSHPNGLCPWCHLNLCPGPKPDKKEYRKNIKNLIAVLEGKKKSVLKNLKKGMKTLSKKERFEEAAKIRNQIQALEKIIETRFQPKETWFLKKRVEAYDISDIQGKEATGSMVVFTNGKPDKNQYRKFRIHPVKSLQGKFNRVKMVEKPNDVAMLKEVLSRRLKHSEWPYPDLILIDGGKAQLNAAKCALPRSAHIPVVALAKKRSTAKSRTKLRFGAGENKLYIEGKKEPVFLKNLPRETFNLILQLRDEAHRFARSYHHHLRKRSLFG